MSTNNITGDSLRTKPATQAYLDNYDAIFKKNTVKEGENNPEDSQNGSKITQDTSRRCKDKD